MCSQCEELAMSAAATVGTILKAECVARQLIPAETEAQHLMRLACQMVDTYNEGDHDIMSVALGYAAALTRLLAIQEIYGIPVT